MTTARRRATPLVPPLTLGALKYGPAPHSPALALLALVASLLAQGSWLGAPERVAPGVELFRSTDQSLVTLPGPIAVYLLRLDPKRVTLASGLSNGEVMDAERVDGIAARYQAIAAVNAGFFNVKNGEPAGLLKVAGELVSDTAISRGIVAIKTPPGAAAGARVRSGRRADDAGFSAGGRDYQVTIDGVDTTRERGKLMLYTPSYHPDTDTARQRHRVGVVRPAAHRHRHPARPGQDADSARRRRSCRLAASSRPSRSTALVAGHARSICPITWTTRHGLSSSVPRSGRPRHQRRRAAQAQRPAGHDLARGREPQPADVHRHAASAHRHRRRSPRRHLARRHRRPPARATASG